MRTNCVNCGAPVQRNQCACPWCNTPYELEDGEYREVTLYMDNQVISRVIRDDFVKTITSISAGGFLEYGHS